MKCPDKNQAALTVSQILVFNSVKHSRDDKCMGQVRHSLDRELALTVYIGLSVHTCTSKTYVIDILFEHGICVQYDKVL